MAEHYFSDASKEDIVSLVHRANGIEREQRFQSKKGLYRPGCKFEKTYGYRVTRRDIEDFIRDYDPKGSVYEGETFEDWLIRRVESVNSSVSTQDSNYEGYAAHSTGRTNFSQRAASSGIDKKTGLLIGGIVFALMLIYAFRSEIMTFISRAIPIVVIIGIIYLVYRFNRKRKGVAEKPAKNRIKKIIGFVLEILGFYVIVFIGGWAYLDGANWVDVFILEVIGFAIFGIGVALNR